MMSESDGRSLGDLLLRDRDALLDLSCHNPLVHLPLAGRSRRALEIIGTDAEQVLNQLLQRKLLTFRASKAPAAREGAVDAGNGDETAAQKTKADPPELSEVAVSPHEVRKSELFLVTRVTEESLQNRLFEMRSLARTLEEDTGINTLYLALGVVTWYESSASEVERTAPLALLPVRLERTSARHSIKLAWREEPLIYNFTIARKFNMEFGVKLPEAPEDDDVDLLTPYLDLVQECICEQPRWTIARNAVVLGFFSFTKYLMYRDLDPKSWPDGQKLDSQPLLRRVLRGEPTRLSTGLGEVADLDAAVPVVARDHIMDADSTQTIAIAEAVGGESMVIKGPPGTGKSQTIANIIAGLVHANKRVLFVSEKSAALEVVLQRLVDAGLERLVLPLHSHRARKNEVLDSFRQVIDVPKPDPLPLDTTRADAASATRLLNARSAALHHREGAWSPYRVVGELAKAARLGIPTDLTIDHPEAPTAIPPVEAVTLLDDLAAARSELTREQAIVFRGVGRGSFDPVEQGHLGQALARLGEALQSIAATARDFSGALGIETPTTLRDVADLHSIERDISAFPEAGDRRILADAAWRDNFDMLQSWVAIGTGLAGAKRELDAVVRPEAWEADADALHATLAAYENKFWRLLSAPFRLARQRIDGLSLGPPPTSDAQRLALMARVVAVQDARRQLQASTQEASAWGGIWRGDETDWHLCGEILAWRRALGAASIRALAQFSGCDAGLLRRANVDIGRGWLAAKGEITRILGTLEVRIQEAFGCEGEESLVVSELVSRLYAYQSQLSALGAWGRCRHAAVGLAGIGWGRVAESALAGELARFPTRELVPAVLANGLRAWVAQRDPDFWGFDGTRWTRRVEQFAAADRESFSRTRQRLMHQHLTQCRSIDPHDPATVLLKRELAKRSRHLPIRRLLARSAKTAQVLKPVFMMSPLSVAHFLEPGAITFDTVVIDEASQIEPVDAIGALARAAQLVVVGDEKQLPPTHFFRRLARGDEEDEDGKEGEEGDRDRSVKDLQSILDLCVAQGFPIRMLRWHYRSQHQSLIAVSNQEFYEGRLLIPPSPRDISAGMGLSYVSTEGSVYDAGGSCQNKLEAGRVVDTALQHARLTPTRSLGVVTFSAPQRRCIQDILEQRRREDPSLEKFFGRDGGDAFFVKNIENVQGDERDVILISVGYGKIKNGSLPHRFGPLNAEGGERRLNVLISRAKQHCLVFCNFSAAEINVERVQSRGVVALKMFLSLAQTGKLVESSAAIDADFDSPLEEEVALAVRGLGFQVTPQLGVTGFRIDLAVSTVDRPGVYVLGIECDGAEYHAMRSCRDRDRLRQQVLEDRGWTILRVWSTDWYLRRETQVQRIADAIQASIARISEEEARAATKTLPQAVPLSFHAEAELDRDVVVGVLGGPEGMSPGKHKKNPAIVPSEAAACSVPYREAVFSVETTGDLHLADLSLLADYVRRVVDAEGPVHAEQVICRIRGLWGLQRSGGRIQARLHEAIERARGEGWVSGEPFLSCPGKSVMVRDRRFVKDSGLRRVEMLPPQEIDAAILQSKGGDGAEATLACAARKLGFGLLSAKLKDHLEGRLRQLLAGDPLSAPAPDCATEGEPQ